jgi:ribosomal protein S27AE
MTSPSEYTILEIQLRASLKRIAEMKELYRKYEWSCGSCGLFIWEATVPSHKTVSQYRPVECGKCSSIVITERDKSR